MLAYLVAVLLHIPTDVRQLTLPPVEAQERVWTTDELKALATDIAKEHHLNVGHFLATIELESGWNPKAQGDFVDGVPTSIGIAQLRYPMRDWGIATSSAYDPQESLEVMGQAWEDGLYDKWSAWRYYEKNGWPSSF